MFTLESKRILTPIHPSEPNDLVASSLIILLTSEILRHPRVFGSQLPRPIDSLCIRNPQNSFSGRRLTSTSTSERLIKDMSRLHSSGKFRHFAASTTFSPT
ncbi:hypothetical protein NPIL_457031 [Nephila pilipes]|uniref:Uncharacterized protein n=1 Tax=Nephila pilipes TaxID=299642 RepID=A0A8X6P2L9_NEPPI|nr:hypothetical protein NPIL_457031 [Nephila pilipes]